ncbi:hypothetical protein VOLCADRAFT_116019 [Volvox carteri f. nagariensis]|uniref:Uncharacterized protein n=1 Tax=Volvox carteri f. nagariensis TaxID=3068 RepID=D8TJH6_VOLCA|nr:uncharacterized protein VOLCADRAFT_116019 [Volvox carteri f. nagariensis]EFJ52375.1 hypothetical protein VOLCADRAFT_116019 [Volvox carteri f. nagariensis]|eukprot:XP_002946448.1 hypothetical protein VOLCADRAFT_116019 [Volvox carteri f. nagariensis]
MYEAQDQIIPSESYGAGLPESYGGIGLVDVARNLKLARRFGEVILPPCILLFRNRQMYMFDQSFDQEDIVQRIRDFVTSGYALAEPLDVPEHRERQLNLEAFEAGQQVDYKTVGFAVLMIVGGLMFQTWAIMNKDKFRPEPGTPEAAAAAAAATKAASAPSASGSEKEKAPAAGAAVAAAAAPAAGAGSPSSASKGGSAKGRVKRTKAS